MHQCFNRMLVLEAMKFLSFYIRAAIEEAASLVPQSAWKNGI